MTDILASGISATTKYDNRTENAEKVLPRLDMRLLATNLQYLLETTQGYSRSGNEGFAQAQNTLSTITVNNYEQYNKSLLQAISTLISHRNYLEVDNSSTPNAITLIKSKITTENAPNNQNYTRENELPFKFQNNLTFTFKAKDNNTGSVSVSIPSLDGFTGSINLVNQDLTSLSANDIIQNYIYEITADRTNNRFILTPHLRKATNQIRGINFLNQPITIANNTTDANNDIDFTAGNFQFSDNSGEALASAMTKRLDASWTAGTNQGGLDTGTKQANTWYYAYAIYNPTTQVSDFIFSANATNPTLPSGFTKYKLIGAFSTNSSSIIRLFTHFVTKNFNYFEYKTPILDYIQVVGNGLLSIPLTIPNIPCFADISAQSNDGAGQTQYHFTITSSIITTLIDSVNTPQGGHAFYGGQWDSRGQLQKIIYTSNSIISFHSKYTLGSSSTVRISTFGFYI